MPDCINPAMKTVEAPGADAHGRCVSAEARSAELAGADDAVLVGCDPSYQTIAIGG